MNRIFFIFVVVALDARDSMTIVRTTVPIGFGEGWKESIKFQRIWNVGYLRVNDSLDQSTVNGFLVHLSSSNDEDLMMVMFLLMFLFQLLHGIAKRCREQDLIGILVRPRRGTEHDISSSWKWSKLGRNRFPGLSSHNDGRGWRGAWFRIMIPMVPHGDTFEVRHVGWKFPWLESRCGCRDRYGYRIGKRYNSGVRIGDQRWNG